MMSVDSLCFPAQSDSVPAKAVILLLAMSRHVMVIGFNSMVPLKKVKEGSNTNTNLKASNWIYR